MRTSHAPLQLPNTDLASYITPLLDKDFDPFDMETSDVCISDDDEDICSFPISGGDE